MDDKIAITGMACRLPGARGVTEFWDSMMQERTTVTRSGPERWNGMLGDIEMFDAGRFGIPQADADAMDPQQRMLLEVAHDAIEDAGVAPGSLAGTRTGVFVAQHTTDYGDLQREYLDARDGRWLMGNHPSATSGRLSFLLDLRGPSLTVNTACSSSLVALHLALNSLRCGDCDRAIVGGVNLALLPVLDEVYRATGLIAEDGRSKFGEVGADGFARSDGVVAVLLRPLEAAGADGDRVRSLLLGSAMTNNGGGRHPLVPSTGGQECLLRDAYRNAGVDPSEVDYVEAHGAGTIAGDAAELTALATVVGAARPAARPCLVGSSKPTVGHTESAAGLVGVLRATLCLERSTVPPAPRQGTLTGPAEPGGGLRLPGTATALVPGRRAAVAGVSSFGATGTAVHVVLGAAPAVDPRPVTGPGRADGALLLLSAGTPAGVADLAWRYHDLLSTGAPVPPLEDVAGAAATRRDRHPSRIAVTARTAAQAASRLSDVASGRPAAGVAHGVCDGEPPRVTFVFSGHGSQWAGMGRDLADREPAFAEAMTRCDEAVRAVAGWSVAAALRSSSPGDVRRPAVAQPLLWAMQVALAATWRSWGVEPDQVVGHSVGEVAAAHVAGVLDLATAAAVVCHRSAMLERLRGTGSMLVVQMPEAGAAALTAEFDDVVVAACNAPSRVVLSGGTAALRRCADRLTRAGVVCGWMDIDVAAHGPRTVPLAGELRARLADVRPRPGRIPFHSTVHDDAAGPAVLDAGYWADNLSRPACFASAMARALEPDTGHAVVEIAPHPVLAASVRDVAAGAGRPALVVGSLRRGGCERESLLDSLGELFVAGVPIGTSGVTTATAHRYVELPTYPWQRSAHWLAAPAPTPAQLRPGPAARTGSSDGPGPSPAVARFLHPLTPATTRPADRRPGSAPGSAGGPGPGPDLHLHPVWRQADAGAAGPEPAASTGTWVVTGPRLACARLVRALHGRGHTAVGVPTDGTGWAARAARAAVSEPACRGVVHLHVPGRAANTPMCAALDAPLELLHALPPAELPLVLVTTGAHGVRDGETGLDPFAAAVWGLARAVDVERPELRCRTIDLDPGVDLNGSGAGLATRTALEALADELARPERADTALRGRTRYVRELVPAAAPGTGTGTVRPDGTYVVTGGLGGLGLVTARVLVDAGARHLLLLGRRGVVDERTRRALRDLRASGADVRTERVDVTDPDPLGRVLDRTRAQGPPIRGVVHTAAGFDDATVTDARPARMRAATAAKADGAWNLHRATEGDPLDLFVLFSSVAAHVGGLSSTGYVAASEFLNGLARHRAARGLPATSVGWGVVRDAGYLDRDPRLNRMLGRSGHVGMTADRFAGELAGVLRTRPTETVVAGVDWGRWAAAHPQLAGLPRYRRIVPDDGGQSGALRRRLDDADPAERPALLPDVVADLLCRTLGRDRAGVDDGTAALGLDSLGAATLRIALRVELGVSVPAAVLLDGIGLDGLCAVVARGLDEVSADAGGAGDRRRTGDTRPFAGSA